MAKSALDGFFRTDALLDPEVRLPSVGEDVAQTLDRLLIFDQFNALFRLLRSDPGGRAFVSDGPVVGQIYGQKVVVLSTTLDTAILPANPYRQYVILWSSGLADIVVSLKTSAPNRQDILLPAGMLIKLAGYTGAIVGYINVSGGRNNGSVNVYEY